MTVRGRARTENPVENRHQDRTRERRRDVRRRPDQRAVPLWLRSDGGRDPWSWQAWNDVVICVPFGEQNRMFGFARAGGGQGWLPEGAAGARGRRAQRRWCATL